MNKISSALALLSLTMCISLPVLAQGPCKPIIDACSKQGYKKGAANIGKGLYKDCVMPVVEGKKTIPDLNVDDKMKQECKAKMDKKMESKMKSMQSNTDSKM